MNPATFAARALLASLVELGVRDIVLCPGSRSAPLAFAALALERSGRVRLHVRHDERVAAFTALGAAKFHNPTVVITTSGTAVANLHPAVLEASHSNIPLIVLSADRPHELRGVGANQTTDQVGIYASAVRWEIDIPARDQIKDDATHLAYYQNVAVRAVSAAVGSHGEAGPGHLNLALREPLVSPEAGGAEDWIDRFTQPIGLTRVEAGNNTGEHAVNAGSKTVVLAGDSAGEGAREIAELGGWPLFAEPSSGARSGPNAIGPYRLMLGEAPLSKQIERVIVFGHATLSRPVQQLLARTDLEVIVVHRGANWPDPPRRADLVVNHIAVTGTPTADWLGDWHEAAKVAQTVLARELGEHLNGLSVAQAVTEATSIGEILWFGSSNPVPDADLSVLWSVDSAPLVAAHRGLAGIDGTISAATGAALATGLPARVLVGDLTFIHDLGSLIIGPHETCPHLQLIIFDDDGGGIFETLEQGGQEYRRDFERVFGTPHGQDLSQITRGLGLETTVITDLMALRDALKSEIKPGIQAIIVKGQRANRREQNQKLAREVNTALSTK